MAIQIICPNCEASFNVADQVRGKKVRCKSCQEPFTATDCSEADDRPSGRKTAEDRLQSEPRPFVRPARSRYDEEVEEPRPVRNRKRLDRPSDSDSGGPSVGLIVGVIAALLVLAVGAVGAGWFFFSSSSAPVPNPAGPMAAVDPANPGQVLPGPGIQGGPPAGGQPGAGGRMVVGKGLRYRWQGGPHVYAVQVEAEFDKYFETHRGNCIIRSEKVAAGPVAQQPRKGTGTAFVVNPNGYLITCAHVVADAAKTEVGLAGKTFPATVLAVDNDHDLALLKIEANNLPVLPLGNSDACELAQKVQALGYPLSSVLGDNLKTSAGTLSGINNKDGRKVFQIDAPINPGNSGGPLMSETGVVIGINRAKLAGGGVSNVGFATPSNEAKRLLTGKGVTFTTGVGGVKLEGPTIYKQSSPAVALVTVTLDPSADERVRLTCSGHLSASQRGKPGIILMPGRPSFPSFGSAPSRVEIDQAGRFLSAPSGGSQMPYLLGELGLFLLDRLPSDNQASWDVTGSCTITEGRSRGFMPPIPRPRMPFGPRFPGEEPKAIGQALEKTVYTRGATAGDTVTIGKRYELKMDPTAGGKGFSLIGDGTITFDTKDGFPRNIEFKAKYTKIEGNTSTSFPITVSYKLIEGAERDRILNPPPPPPPPPAKELTDGEMTQVLADLKGADKGKQKAAVDRLAKAKVTEARRPDVAKALNAIVADAEYWTKKSCLEAIGKWGDKDSVPVLVPIIEDKNVFIRHGAIAALSELKVEAAAEPLAKCLIPFGDRGVASAALKKIGSKAEKAVLPYLKNADWGVRLAVCQLLKEIGTKQSKAALEEASNDSNGLVKREAAAALAAVSARP